MRWFLTAERFVPCFDRRAQRSLGKRSAERPLARSYMPYLKESHPWVVGGDGSCDALGMNNIFSTRMSICKWYLQFDVLCRFAISGADAHPGAVSTFESSRLQILVWSKPTRYTISVDSVFSPAVSSARCTRFPPRPQFPHTLVPPPSSPSLRCVRVRSWLVVCVDRVSYLPACPRWSPPPPRVRGSPVPERLLGVPPLLA